MTTAEDDSKELPSDLELVTVLETGDPTLLSIAESLLQEAKVPYTKSGELLQNLFGGGQLGLGYSLVAGPPRLQVPREHQQAAQEILASIQEAPSVPAEEDE